MKELDTGDIGDSGCPCGEVLGDGYEIQSHCWRTYTYFDREDFKDKCDCAYSGVHYFSEKEDVGKEHAEGVARHIEESWGVHDVPVLWKKARPETTTRYTPSANVESEDKEFLEELLELDKTNGL